MHIKSTRLYKQNANDAEVLVKFMQWLFTHFDTRHSVISDQGTQIQSVFKRDSQVIWIANRLIIDYQQHGSGKEEVKNRQLKWTFLKTIDESVNDW